jgi:hypothetical protein
MLCFLFLFIFNISCVFCFYLFLIYLVLSSSLYGLNGNGWCIAYTDLEST